MFCGGKRCKYESINNWKIEDQAIEGLFSHWITDDILAMARPNTSAITKHKILEQFQQQGVQSIINLQTPGIIQGVHLISQKNSWKIVLLLGCFEKIP